MEKLDINEIGIERRCKMGRLIVFETDRGHYVVRPEHWAGMYKDGKIKKGGLNHTAVFMNKEDAELFVKCKEQPIAYDVEAVVKELEELKDNAVKKVIPKNVLAHIDFVEGIDKAIEIIRKGGVK